MDWRGIDKKNLVGKLTNKKYFISIPSFQSILSLFKIKQVIQLQKYKVNITFSCEILYSLVYVPNDSKIEKLRIRTPVMEKALFV